MPTPAVLAPSARRRRPAAPTPDPPPIPTPPPLRDGDRLGAEEFLRRYRAMPEDFRAELVDGKVCVPMPVRHDVHAKPTSQLTGWLFVYSAHTPGTDTATDGTTVLGPRDVPQPDAMLRVLPEFGGQTTNTPDGLVAGAPELVAEVSASSVRADAGAKRAAYLAAGVREYLVWRTEDAELDWLVRRGDGDGARFEPLPAGAGGVLESEAFPGLRLDRPALLRGDAAAVLAGLNGGLASPAHAAFAAELAAAAAS